MGRYVSRVCYTCVDNILCACRQCAVVHVDIRCTCTHYVRHVVYSCADFSERVAGAFSTRSTDMYADIHNTWLILTSRTAQEHFKAVVAERDGVHRSLQALQATCAVLRKDLEKERIGHQRTADEFVSLKVLLSVAPDAQEHRFRVSYVPGVIW